MLLESSGLAAMLLSEVESQKAQVTSTTIQYPGTDGVQVSGYLSVPQSKEKFPAVVIMRSDNRLPLLHRCSPMLRSFRPRR